MFWVASGPEYLLEDGILLISVHVLRDEPVRELAEEEAPELLESRWLDLGKVPDDVLIRLRERCLQSELQYKVVATVLEDSSLDRQLSVLENYPMQVEVCTTTYSRTWGPWSPGVHVRGSLTWSPDDLTDPAGAGQPSPTADKSLAGPAGEHYAIYELLRRGMVAVLAPGGLKKTDIFILDQDHRQVGSLQVKTRTHGRRIGWRMSEKHEEIRDPDLYYAFIDLEPDKPITYIVPSGIVADVLQKSYRAYLAEPGRNRSESTTRYIRPEYAYEVPGVPTGWMEPFKEQWGLFGQSDSD